MFFVYGLQKSGISIAKLFEKKNTSFKIWDDSYKVRKQLKNTFYPLALTKEIESYYLMHI